MNGEISSRKGNDQAKIDNEFAQVTNTLPNSQGNYILIYTNYVKHCIIFASCVKSYYIRGIIKN